MPPHDPSLAPGEDAGRFAFGRNWQTFLAGIDEQRLLRAERSIAALLDVESLAGRRFLDAGCGSGIFSLAARRLGAVVHSFDFDPDSVSCAQALRQRFFPSDPGWRIEQGSVLDAGYLSSLGQFDIVYSWGVLHHTGAMWSALENVARLVKPGGTLCIAIYNDQGWRSSVWRAVKRVYNALPARLRFLVLWPALIRLWGPTVVRDLLRGRPMRTWMTYAEERGMSPLVDVRDWVGGYPFEVASAQAIVDFFRSRELTLVRAIPRSGIGCNEFVFCAGRS